MKVLLLKKKHYTVRSLETSQGAKITEENSTRYETLRRVKKLINYELTSSSHTYN